ncbi:ATP-binding protein [Rugamonas sp. CCM 8940]|uniref:sensor histidine kinase n=1 Tax=Rugamonas sp. CCM 8940 TaxID=2765359 RepID=UPI0018F33573|nr:HAMP domain-containing sensor histidine kinase [Rugamonas sp. CCM 8940]MBJ7313621.1 HAMP domain-containing histidine kinase [Rugamonas sp. CCM 8940]
MASLRLLERFRNGTFRRQLSVVVSVGVLSVATVSALISSWQGSVQARGTLVEQGLNLATGLAQQSQLALLTDGAENASEAMQRALAFPDVLRVELLRANGQLLVARGAELPLAPLQPGTGEQAPRLESETDTAWSFVVPVRTRPGEASPFDGADAAPELLGFVRVTQGKQALARLVRRMALVNFGAGLLLAALMVAGLRMLAHRLTEPLGRLSQVMANAGAGRLGQRASLDGPRDIASMAQVFNDMMRSLEQREQELQFKNAELARHAETLEQRVAERTQSLSSAHLAAQEALDHLRLAQGRLVESEKLASLGRLVAGVAHELNTPIGNALMAVSTLIEEQDHIVQAIGAGQVRKSELLATFQTIAFGNNLVFNNVQRAADIIGGFKQLAVDQTTEMRRRFMLDEVIAELLASMQPMFRNTNFRIERELEEGLQMDSYPGPLGQVIANLVQNAKLHAFDGREHGVLTVRCRACGPQRVRIECSDDGAGIPAEVRAHIFEAFFTTKLGRGGTGLGMQIVHNMVNGLLGGEIAVESEPGQGTRVLITLARQAPPHPSASAGAQ